jgi:hypothetical protein
MATLLVSHSFNVHNRLYSSNSVTDYNYLLTDNFNKLWIELDNEFAIRLVLSGQIIPNPYPANKTADFVINADYYCDAIKSLSEEFK